MTQTSRQTQTLTQTPQPQSQPQALSQRCACGGMAGQAGECTACRHKREAKKGTLQREASSSVPVNSVPPIVQDVLRSPGQPLDPNTRAYMEPRFGHDFSGVRIHTDAQAAASAQAVQAHAYTVGQHVVFGVGEYRPQEASGRALLAHELTHTVQQERQPSHQPLEISAPRSAAEREADQVMLSVAQGTAAQVRQQLSPALQRFPACAPLLSAEERGSVTERSVQAELASMATRALGGGVQRELLIPAASFQQHRDKDRVAAGGDGFADIVYTKGSVMEILEVKRATWSDAVDGERQVLNYVEKGDRDVSWKQQQGVSSVTTMPTTRFQPTTPTRISNTPVSLGWCRDGLITFKAVGDQDQDVFVCTARDQGRTDRFIDHLLIRGQDRLNQVLSAATARLKEQALKKPIREAIRELLHNPAVRTKLGVLVGSPTLVDALPEEALINLVDMAITNFEPLIRAAVLDFVDRLMTQVRLKLREQLRSALQDALNALCATAAALTASEVLDRLEEELRRRFSQVAIGLVPMVVNAMLADAALEALKAVAIAAAIVIGLLVLWEVAAVIVAEVTLEALITVVGTALARLLQQFALASLDQPTTSSPSAPTELLSPAPTAAEIA